MHQLKDLTPGKKDIKPKVSIVILNWNGVKHLKTFLPSVYNTKYENLEIVIGDNDSSDESVEYVKANYPNIKLIINEQNYGFARGYNEVLKKVVADHGDLRKWRARLSRDHADGRPHQIS